MTAAAATHKSGNNGLIDRAIALITYITAGVIITFYAGSAILGTAGILYHIYLNP